MKTLQEKQDQKKHIITLRNIACRYILKGKLYSMKKQVFWALKDVSFDVYDEEALGIIGKNGAGKSTLLRLLSGIIKPDKGTIIRSHKKVSLLSLQVGFLPYLSGRKNAILSGLMLGLTYQQIEGMIASIIDFSGLRDFIDQPISTYSSGMRARLGFSVAFHTDPDVLMIDEVLGVGDEEFKKKSSEEMKKKISSNKTVILVSHNVNTIRELCSRAVWIHEGITMMEGDTDYVVNEYLDFNKKNK